MKTAKLGAMFLVSVLALAGASAGYAMWSETLYIDGYVETGELDVAWSIEDWGDDEIVGKDYSWIEAEIIGYTLYVDIYNAYPCITYWVDVNIENTGTIPFHIYWDGIIEWDFPGTVTFVPDPNCEQIHPGGFWYGRLEIHLNNNALEEMTYYFSTDLVVHQWNEAYP